MARKISLNKDITVDTDRTQTISEHRVGRIGSGLRETVGIYKSIFKTTAKVRVNIDDKPVTSWLNVDSLYNEYTYKTNNNNGNNNHSCHGGH